MGRARKWPESEATAVKVGELVALFPGHVGQAIKWPESEATCMFRKTPMHALSNHSVKMM